MNINAALKAGTQLAKGGQPRVRALNHPAVPPKSVIALDASAGDTVPNTETLEVRAAPGEVIALVCMQLGGPAPRPARLAAHARQGVDQLLKDHRIMAIGPGDAKHQWDALAVRDEVALAAKFAPVRGVGPCVRAPRGLGTLAPSIQARLKSSLSALRSSVSNAKCRRCHTPAACQSRNRLQQVMPLPKPNSWGKCSHGVPVRSTNRMPFKACSSLSRGLPPLGEGSATGSNGAILLYNAVLISLFLFFPMPRQTHYVRLAMTGFC
jgi:hypothetical protein